MIEKSQEEDSERRNKALADAGLTEEKHARQKGRIQAITGSAGRLMGGRGAAQGLSMISLTEDRLTLSAAFAVPFAAAAWWLFIGAAPAVASTYAFIAVLVIALALVGANTWHNGQPTGSMGQLIYEANRTPDTTSTNRPISPALNVPPASRWDAWQARGDAHATTGRARGLLAFSIVATGALLLYAWVM